MQTFREPLKKSVVLLSGGLDSTVAFRQAVDTTEVKLALTFDYGQRAAKREIAAAEAMAGLSGVPHAVIGLPWLKEVTKTALVDEGRELPKLGMGDLDGETGKTGPSARAVWVPNRNGVFINIAAAYCEALEAELIFTGFNREEAATFPDNSPGFVDAVNDSLSYSTLSKVKVVSPTSSMDKNEIVRFGIENGAPLEHLWSCYEGGAVMCGRCESCLRLKRALDGAGSDLRARLFP